MYILKETNPYYPVNPHRYYKGDTLAKPAEPIGSVNDCGYTAETPTPEKTCYVKQFSIPEGIITVRICLMADGSLKTTHERSIFGIKGSQPHGVEIINDAYGNTTTKAITKEFMLKIQAPKTGTYPTLSKLFPMNNYLNKTQVATKYQDKAEVIGAIAGAGSFAVAIYWIWKAIMFYRDKQVGFLKPIFFRTVPRVPEISNSFNRVQVDKEGLYANFKFTLQKGERGSRTICR